MNRYLIGILALIGLIIILILILSSGGHKAVVPPHAATLPSFANSNSEVSVVVEGPIVAPQDYNEASIVINKNTATFTLYQGYNGQVINKKVLNNTENSYTNFLYALYYAGYQKTILASVKSDIGLCSTGYRYDFYLDNNGHTVSHSWITNCNNDPQTFDGNLSLTLQLYNAQIPQIDSYIQNTSL